MKCPHCDRDVDAADKDVGTRLYHPACNGWFIVARRMDGTKYAIKSQPVATYPKK